TATKIADHGSFNEDDVHVALLVSNPDFAPARFDEPVETRQIACTILNALGISCSALQSQAIEPSTPLPIDNTAPVVSVPTDMIVEAIGSGGSAVTFNVTADDPNGVAGPVTCEPSSGATFPIGATTVTCSSTDAHDNTGSGTFSITVRDTTPPVVSVPAPMT